jgi:hypothetical protein
MANWEKQEIELDKRGIYCSFGTYMATKDYSLFITRADGKSLMDYFCKKECLEILNKFIDKNYETFDDFMKSNGFIFKENELGKYLVLRDTEKLDYIEKFNKNSIVASFSFIAKAILKYLVLSLALYLKCNSIYSNNEIIGLGKGSEHLSKTFNFSDNLINQIVKEVYNKSSGNNSFYLNLSETYEQLKNKIETLSKEYNKTGIIYKISNEENPAYLQKRNKVDFLTKGYYFVDKKTDKKMVNVFKFANVEDLNKEKEVIKSIKNYFTKGTI